MSLHEVRGYLRERAETGKPVGVAVLLRAWRTAPRAPGARFAAGSGTATAGSISAGCVEADLREQLAAVVRDATPRIVRYGISDADAMAVGLSCGGEIEVLVRDHDPADPVWRELESALDSDEEAVLATALWEPGLGRRMLVRPGRGTVGSLGDEKTDSAVIVRAERALAEQRKAGVEALEAGRELFLEPMLRPHQLIVVGATPLALALARLAETLNVRRTIVEPRETLAETARGAGVPTIQASPEEAFSGLNVDRRTAVAVIAHADRLDVEALRAALVAGAGYVGLLGGRRTQRLRREALEASGVDASQISKIRGPIGLDIGAESPAEIALAILAEVVQFWSSPAPSASGRRDPA